MTLLGTNEHITREPGNVGAWVCICGNRTDYDGFFPCDKDGNEMQPVQGWVNVCVCFRCGRIIDQQSLEVVGQNPGFKPLP